MKNKTYYVQGMHCASCELLIERSLLENKHIKSADASLGSNSVTINYENSYPTVEELNKRFKNEGYVFSETASSTTPLDTKKKIGIIGIALGIIILFVGLNKLGIANLISVNEDTSIPFFFLFGVIAGISSCAALVGGLILSLAKQWNENEKRPGLSSHILFNLGRLASYAVFGLLLGALGKTLNLSIKFGPILVILVTLIMIVLALQMLGVKYFNRFRIGLPKFLYKRINTNSDHKYSALLLGAATFFLPCGFTITAQSMALLSGRPWQGMLIMLAFALGTLPALLLIGYSSEKLVKNKKLSELFLKVAGIVVIFFALFTLNAQLNAMGVSSLSDIKTSNVEDKQVTGLVPLVNGKQLLKMNASSSGYTPNSFKIRVGVPVRWEITDTGTSGCTNAVIAKSFFPEEIPLTTGQTSVKEFTPTKTGKFKFSCWMGMISGIIEVVDPTSAGANTTPATNIDFALSGGESLGGSCSMGSSCSCGSNR